MSRLMLLSLLVLACASPSATGQKNYRIYHVDPQKGRKSGDGSAQRPWRTLEEVAAGGALGAIEGGSQVLLAGGDHGAVSLSGTNAETITIAAAPGQQPRLSRLELRSGSRWVLRGLTVSPAYGDTPYKGSILTVGERGPASDVSVEDCFVHGALDSSEWGVEEWMGANSGMRMGRHSTGLVFRNNYVLNTRFGIDLCAPESLCEGNVVSNFSGDGIRVTRDGITLQYNVIKNGYCSAADGDPNHDDAIQCFLFNKGTGTVRRAAIRGNLIINREDDRQRFPVTLQAIGFFDGPLIDFVVEGNVVCTSHWHGISLFDAQGCKILNNAVFTRWTDVRLRPWIMLGQKKKLARGNTVRNNLAHSFRLDADPEVRAANNEKVSERAFFARFKRLRAEIDRRHGKRHPTAGRPRVELEWRR